MKRLILRYWKTYITWTDTHTGFFKHLSLIPFYIIVGIYLFFIYFFVVTIISLIHDFNNIFTGDGLIIGLKNLFSQGFWGVLGMLIMIVVFLVGGWILIIIGETLTFLMNDHKRRVDNLNKPKKKRKK